MARSTSPFCFGILYHMENPILGMKKLAAVTDQLIMVDTSVLQHPIPSSLIKWPLWRMQIVPAIGGIRNEHIDLALAPA